MKRLMIFVENLFTNCAIASTVIMMCLTSLDAIGRYVLNRPIVWAYEITESYLMILTIYLAICYSYRQGALIRVTFVIDRLPNLIKMGLNYLVHIFSILLSITLLAASIYQTQSIFMGGDTLDTIPIKVWPAYLIISIGLLSMILAMVVDLCSLKDSADLIKEDHPNL